MPARHLRSPTVGATACCAQHWAAAIWATCDNAGRVCSPGHTVVHVKHSHRHGKACWHHARKGWLPRSVHNPAAGLYTSHPGLPCPSLPLAQQLHIRPALQGTSPAALCPGPAQHHTARRTTQHTTVAAASTQAANIEGQDTSAHHAKPKQGHLTLWPDGCDCHPAAASHCQPTQHCCRTKLPPKCDNHSNQQPQEAHARTQNPHPPCTTPAF